jgi:putative ABC transport system substrate-binding protein
LIFGCVAFPASAWAQQPAVPLVGFLNSRSAEQSRHLVAAFQKGLSEAGFVDFRDVAVEYRWAAGRYEALPALARDLVDRRVAVIVAGGAIPSALAAKQATQSIPIVFTSVDDPVAAGLVASLGRPGGNATGFSLFTNVLTTKLFELLLGVAGGISAFAVLVNPNNPNAGSHLREAAEASRAFGVGLDVLHVVAVSELDTSLAAASARGMQALLVTNDPLFNIEVDRIAAAALRHKVPAASQFREFATAGGLMSYGTNLAEVYRATGGVAGRILKGATPAELLVMRPTTFELVLNRKTANALGLTITPAVLARADEVIE